MMDLLTAIFICTAAIGGKAFPDPFQFPDGENCTRYGRISQKAMQCAGNRPTFIFQQDEIIPSDVLAIANLTCTTRQEKRTCMENAFSDCVSKETILSNWDRRGFTFCEGNEPASWIVEYARSNTNAISKECLINVRIELGACAHQVVVQLNWPRGDVHITLQEGLNLKRRLTDAVFDCAIDDSNQDYLKTPECSNLKRKDILFVFVLSATSFPGQAFGIRLTNEQLTSLQDTVTGDIQDTITTTGWEVYDYFK